jgi:4'-phosphopantetheinyl transferase
MSPRLWWVHPESVPADSAALGLLNDEERHQYQRYIPPAKRQEYLATRIMVRTVLGAALDVAPQALEFTRNEWGRPALVHTSLSAPVHFNVSHTDGLVLCLVGSHYEIGVDTELFSRAPKLLELAPRVFAPQELADLTALPDDEQAETAVTLWTLKESYIKARGMGLALPLSGFAFGFDGAQTHLTVEPALNDDGARWKFETFRLGAHCVSTALALPSAQARVAMDCIAIKHIEFLSEF